MLRPALLLMFLAMANTAFAQEEIRKSIYFDGGSWYIDEGQSVELSRWLDSIPNLLDKYRIQLISHTDPIGGKEYNEYLSQMRSTAVLQLLVEQHIPTEVISVKDWGLENPVYSNDDWGGRVMNRRVDVIVFPVVF
jgi:outer membrane protein OmpA-like peptidoglycan-associated protein